MSINWRNSENRLHAVCLSFLAQHAESHGKYRDLTTVSFSGPFSMGWREGGWQMASRCQQVQGLLQRDTLPKFLPSSRESCVWDWVRQDVRACQFCLNTDTTSHYSLPSSLACTRDFLGLCCSLLYLLQTASSSFSLQVKNHLSTIFQTPF